MDKHIAKKTAATIPAEDKACDDASDVGDEECEEEGHEVDEELENADT